MKRLDHKTIKRLKWLKKFYAAQIWRMKQSQVPIMLVFYSLTLAGVYLPWVAMFVPVSKWILTPVLAVVSLLGLLALGYAYDNIFKQWKEDMIIQTERNPYTLGKLAPKETKLHARQLELFRAQLATMETNFLMAEKLGLDVKKYKKSLKDMEEVIKAQEKWLKEGWVS